MQLEAVPYDRAEQLVRALAIELTERYGGGTPSVSTAEDFLPPYGLFLVGWVDGVAAACGGVRPLPGGGEGVGEVKRMYVGPAHRGRGLSRVLLRALVAHARSVGLRELWLETGTQQPEAMGLYESEGFGAIPAYGQYRDEPESRCYRLVL